MSKRNWEDIKKDDHINVYHVNTGFSRQENPHLAGTSEKWKVNDICAVNTRFGGIYRRLVISKGNRKITAVVSTGYDNDHCVLMSQLIILFADGIDYNVVRDTNNQ